MADVNRTYHYQITIEGNGLSNPVKKQSLSDQIIKHGPTMCSLRRTYTNGLKVKEWKTKCRTKSNYEKGGFSTSEKSRF